MNEGVGLVLLRKLSNKLPHHNNNPSTMFNHRVCGSHLWALGIWTVGMVSIFGLLTWQVYQLFSSYIDGTHYGTNVYIENQDSLTVPNITICNLNKVNVSKMREIEMDIDAAVFFVSDSWYTYPISISTEGVNGARYRNAWQNFSSKITGTELSNTNRLLEVLAHSCDETIAMLRFGSEEPMLGFRRSKGQKICEKFVAIKNMYGVCYSMLDSYVQLTPGVTEAVRLVLLPHTELYLPSAVANTMEQGVAVLVNFSPLGPFPREPVHISAGTSTTIVMRKRMGKFRKPMITIFDWPCRSNASHKLLKAKYTNSNCFYDCFHYSILKKCNCTPASFELQDWATSFNTCNLQSLCYSSANGNPETWYVACGKACQKTSCFVTCESSYTVDLVTNTGDMSDAPLREFYQILNINSGNASRNISSKEAAMVTIYYSDFGIAIQETAETQSFFQFIGNFGGQIGLWIGASAASLMEVVYALLLCKKPTNKNTSNTDLPHV